MEKPLYTVLVNMVTFALKYQRSHKQQEYEQFHSEFEGTGKDFRNATFSTYRNRTQRRTILICMSLFMYQYKNYIHAKK